MIAYILSSTKYSIVPIHHPVLDRLGEVGRADVLKDKKGGAIESSCIPSSWMIRRNVQGCQVELIIAEGGIKGRREAQETLEIA